MKHQSYNSKINPVKVGQTINIKGKTDKEANRFVVFLGVDNGLGCDFGSIPFYLAVEFSGEPKVARTSYTKGIGWEKEEVKENLLSLANLNPIKRGNVFKISISIEKDKFVVCFDDHPFCSFPFCQDLCTIKNLTVAGDIQELYEIEHLPTRVNNITNGAKTFSATIPEIRSDVATAIKGILSGDEGELEINLIAVETGKTLLEMKTNLAKKKFVAAAEGESLSSKNSSSFDDPKNFPLVTGQTFKLVIGISKHEFVIAINGTHRITCAFKDKSFLGTPVKFQVTSSNGLSCCIIAVDSLTVDKPAPPSGYHQVIDIERTLAEKRTSADSTIKVLARILHH